MVGKYYICKKISFDSSHRLWNPELNEEENFRIFGKCANSPSHGHTYTCEIVLESDRLENGMVANFTDVKRIAKETVIDRFDHHFINDLMPGEITTAENIARFFYTKLKPQIPQLHAIRIWETPDSWAEYGEGNHELQK